MSELAGDRHENARDESTQLLIQSIEATLNSRLEPLNFNLLMAVPDIPDSLRVVNSELGFRLHLSENVEQCQAKLTSVIDILARADQQLPRVSLPEKLALQTRKAVWKLTTSSAPLFLVRSGLMLLTRLQAVLQLPVEDVRRYHQLKVDILSNFLQEPEQKTARLIQRNQFYLYWNYARRLRHLSQKNSGHAMVPDYCWADRADYSAMTKLCKDSRVLATIHMGDFFGAFKCIADELQEARPTISLRRDGDTDGIKHLSQRLAEEHRVYMHGKDNPVRIVKALREGGQTLSILFDLAGDFGETTEVIFFGHRARFVRGPAEMAILGRARIYPFVCVEDAGQSRICMEPSFMPALQKGEDLQDAVTRVTQTLVSLAERWIRQNPAQWKYLDRLPHYLILDKPDSDVELQHSTHEGAGFDA